MAATLNGLVHIKTKLVTKEDPQHLHKVLGISALVSFFYRYYYVYNTEGNLGFNGTLRDWITVTLHMGLASSSLIFHVIAKRLQARPMVIYEEYRLHAITFTARCVAVYIFGIVRPFRGTYLERVLLLATVLFWHLIADEITRRHGTQGVSAVRCQNGSDNRGKITENPTLMQMVKAGMKFYSFYQIAAICIHLTPCERTADMGYNTIIAIQSSAFLMTLYRKGLIYQHSHAFWYSLALILSLFHMYQNFPSPFLWAQIGAVFALRLLGVNKYLLYVTFALVPDPLLAVDNTGLLNSLMNSSVVY